MDGVVEIIKNENFKFDLHKFTTNFIKENCNRKFWNSMEYEYDVNARTKKIEKLSVWEKTDYDRNKPPFEKIYNDVEGIIMYGFFTNIGSPIEY